jgi:hypothetical protein
VTLLSFDIEISDVFDLKPHEDLDKYAPFHISVAATAVHGGEERVWYSADADGRPALNLTPEKARELLEYLRDMQQKNVMVCAWNGLSFDLRWIGYQANDMKLAAEVALKSYDPMFQFFNIAGFPVGLAKVAEAMGVRQEKLMHGSQAPVRWREGDHQLVMDYCLGDCQMTNQIVRAIQKAYQVQWITAKGLAKSKPMRQLKTVEQVLQDPEPDQSWMSTPMPRSKFCQWLVEAGV